MRKDDVPFILTSSPAVEDHDRALALGADNYFIKPFKLKELRRQAQLIALRWSRIVKAYGEGKKST